MLYIYVVDVHSSPFFFDYWVCFYVCR